MTEFDFVTEIDRTATNSLKWDGVDEGQLAMGLADMDLRTAPAVLDALRRQVDHGIYGYTDLGPGLLDAVCGWVSERRGWEINPDWLTSAPGVMPSIAHLLNAGLERGAEVIVQTPAFPPIPDVIEANGLSVIESPLQVVDGLFQMDLDRFAAQAARGGVEAFVLCNPHNPSGRVWSREELSAIAAVADAQDLLVISDEIHGEVVFPWAEFVSYGTVAAATSRYAVCFGPSKAFNLASLVLSLVAVPDDQLRAALRAELFRVNEGFGVSGPGAVALEEAFENGRDWLDALGKHLETNLATLTTGLQAGGVAVDVVRPDASFLVWVDCRRLGLDDDSLIATFDRVGVKIEPGRNFGPGGAGFVRVNIGTTTQRVAEAVERIVAGFDQPAST